jgi:hypothetical protein
MRQYVKIFVNFKKACGTFRKKVLHSYNSLIEFWVPVKLVRLMIL